MIRQMIAPLSLLVEQWLASQPAIAQYELPPVSADILTIVAFCPLLTMLLIWVQEGFLSAIVERAAGASKAGVTSHQKRMRLQARSRRQKGWSANGWRRMVHVAPDDAHPGGRSQRTPRMTPPMTPLPKSPVAISPSPSSGAAVASPTAPGPVIEPRATSGLI